MAVVRFASAGARRWSVVVGWLLAIAIGGHVLAAARQVTTSPSTQYQEVIAHWASITVTTVDAAAFGAKGDGAIATDCAIAAASTTLTCATPHFSPDDAGKVVSIERAGRAWPGADIVQPLATSIRVVVSPTTITLARQADSAAEPSPRVVWGTDDTSALQRAVDALSRPSFDLTRGGILSIPAGRFLVRGLILPCARTGNVERGRCDRTYNNVWIKGAGPNQTMLENWDPDAPQRAVIRLGERAGTPDRPGAPNQPLSFVAVTDLGVRQVAYATQTKNAILGEVTNDVWILNTHGENYSYECYVDGASRRWRVSDNVMGPCGHGGPAYASGTSALNLTGWEWLASRNHVTGSAQAAEVGGYRWTLEDNVFDGGMINASGGVIGNADGVIRRNTITDASIVVTNVIGTTSHTQILDNLVVNGEVAISSGLDANSVVVPGYPTGDIHGTSIVRGNQFRIGTPLDGAVIRVGFVAHKYEDSEGLESVEVENNTIEFSKLFVDRGPAIRQECRPGTSVPSPGTCRIYTTLVSLSAYGGRTWRPRTSYVAAAPNADTSHVVPTIDNGFLYVATRTGTSGATEPVFPDTVGASVRDGTVVWQNEGPRPRVTLRNNQFTAPDGAGGGEVSLFENTDRAALHVEPGGIATNFAWSLRDLPADSGLQESVPAGAPYDDMHRFVTSPPEAGTYAAATQLRHVRPWPSSDGWVVTRAGRAAHTHAPDSQYAYGAFVRPDDENGHVYMQIAPTACTSDSATPAWSGPNVSDGTCIWRESGSSLGLAAANGVLFDLQPFDPTFAWTAIDVDPAPGAQGISPRHGIAARFNDAAPADASMTLESCDSEACTTRTPLAGVASYAAGRRAASLTPAVPYEPLRWYRASVRSGARAVSWTFRAGANQSQPRAAYSFTGARASAIVDESGNGNTLTPLNGTGPTAAGHSGGALALDGVGDQAVAPVGDSLTISDGLTVEAWVYPTGTPPHGVIASVHGSFTLRLVDRRLQLSLATRDGQVLHTGAAIIPANAWTHVAATYDGTTPRLYVNGALTPSGGPNDGGAIVTITDQPLEIGGAPGEWLAGRLDDLRIYGRALAAREVASDRDTPVR